MRTIFFGHGKQLVKITFTFVSLIGRYHQSSDAHAPPLSTATSNM